MAIICCADLARADFGAGTKIALVIGNSGYAGGLALPDAAADAKDFATALKNDGFEVSLQLDLTKDGFGKALADFDRASRNADVALVYYAGHGVQYRDRNFLLPVDNVPRDNQDIKYKSVALSDVIDAAGYAHRAKIIILDACRNTLVDHAKPGSRAVTGVGDRAGLASVEGSDGLVVFFSAQPGKTAFDGGSGDHSPFADSIIKRITEPGRDIKEIFTEVTSDVRNVTRSLQEPETVTASLTEPIILSPEETAEQAYQKVRKSTDPAVLKDFMKRFPDSLFADAIQDRLDKLDMQRRNDERAKEEKQRAEALEAERKQREKLEAERAEDEKRRALKDQEDRDAHEKELAVLKAQKDAAEAQIVEAHHKSDQEKARIAALIEQERQKRLQAEAEAALKAQDLAKADAEAKRAAAEALAAKKAREDQDTAQREAVQREAAQKAAEAQAAADRARKAQEDAARAKKEDEARQAQARLDEAARRKADEDHIQKIKAEACTQDLAQLEKYKQARQLDLIKTLAAETSCPAYSAAAAKAIKDVADAVSKACDSDQRTLAKVDARNVDALKAALGGFTCDAVRKSTEQKIGLIEQENARVAEACSNERIALNAIDASAPSARADLLALRGKAVCPEMPKIVDRAVSQIDTRVSAAQEELVRVGCLTKATGRFDDATVAGLASYLKARNAPADSIRITDGLVTELSGQLFKVCVTQSGTPVASTESATPAAVTPTSPGTVTLVAPKPPAPAANASPPGASPASTYGHANVPPIALVTPRPPRVLAPPPAPKPHNVIVQVERTSGVSAGHTMQPASPRLSVSPPSHSASPALASPPVGISF